MMPEKGPLVSAALHVMLAVQAIARDMNETKERRAAAAQFLHDSATLIVDSGEAKELESRRYADGKKAEREQAEALRNAGPMAAYPSNVPPPQPRNFPAPAAPPPAAAPGQMMMTREQVEEMVNRLMGRVS